MKEAQRLEPSLSKLHSELAQVLQTQLIHGSGCESFSRLPYMRQELVPSVVFRAAVLLKL